MPDNAAAEAGPEPRRPSESASVEKPLDTVSVPAEFRPIFLRAQQYVEQYFSDRVEDPRHSSILISGERYILVRAASMSVEFFDLVTSLYQDKGPDEARKVASNLLFDVAHAIGKADARSFHEKMGVTDPIERLSVGPVHFSFSGWAFVDISPQSRPSPDQNYFLIYNHPFSFESDAWIRHGRKSEQPVCVMNAGYSSGWCEESFGIPLVAAEVECQAMGDEHCRFVMAPPERIEEHLHRYWQSSQTEPKQARHAGAGATGNAVPEFFQRKRMEEELRKSHAELERRVAERTGEVVRAYEQLMREVEERQRAETLRTALYRIAEAADRTASLDELYQQVQEIIAKVILAKSFYIALYDEEQDTVFFPYYLDEVDPKLTTRKAGKGRTEYVLRTGKSLLCTAELQRELQERGEVESIGAPTAVWLGVPLRIEGKTIGVMAVQHYTDPAAYGENERQVLEYVSSQVARAIARKRAEEELQESEKRLRTLAEASFEGLVFSENGVILETNEQTARMLGYFREEVVGRHISDFVAFESREQVMRAVQTDDTETYEHMLIRKDGSILPVETCARILQSGGRKTRVTAIRDITERKRVEQAHQQSEERFAKAFDSSPEGISISTQKEGRLLEVNDAYVRMMGYERSELIGKTVKELNLWAPGERDRVLDKLEVSGAIRDYNTTFRMKGDRIREAQISVDKIRVQEEPCLLVTIRDVTESRLMELQLRAAQKMEAVGRLAGGVAHDFNNVLMIISSAARMMQSAAHDENRKAHYLSQIQTAAGKATSLTMQLLAFSRQQVLHPAVLDLNVVVSDLWKMLPQLLGEDVETALHLASDLGSVNADRGQIEQVIMNLAVNARDAMPGGGKLIVETANAALDGSALGHHPAENPSGDFVMLAMTDTGTGMDAETQAKIFEPFFTTKEIGKGTGLGLATVYGIVQQSAGHVTVKSEPGGGATFKVYLPRVREKAVPALIVASKPALGGTETLLLVEDEAALRELASEFLRSRGYTVLEAGNRRDALHVCRNHQSPIHVLVTDVVLPGGGGPDLAKVVLEMRPNLRVIYMSGYTDQVLSEELVGENATFLQKPFDLETLARTLRSVLGEKT
jgi:two-component system cell cycle sensor histidine kinase/response regulator CckA